MILSAADADHLRWLLDQLLPAPEAEAVFLRHSETPAPSWREIGRRLQASSLKAHWIYRKGLKQLRRSGRLLSGLLLESPNCDR